jgi:uncharacterized protein (TIGR04255 family)
MPDTPTFANPPIIELVLGAQFTPLNGFSAGHFGLFWNLLGQDWTHPADAPIIEDRFEHFENLRWDNRSEFQVRILSAGRPGRFQLGHKNDDRLVQIQASRFHLNWRKRPGGVYLSYKKLIDEFEATFTRFAEFAEQAGLGTIAVNQWEVTYIDAFAKGETWQSPADWSKILPGLFGPVFQSEVPGCVLERRAAEWSFEIQPRLGRLHVETRPGRWGESKEECLLLEMTARGPVGRDGVKTLREGLDKGHEVAVGAFLQVVADHVKQKWGQPS